MRLLASEDARSQAIPELSGLPAVDRFCHQQRISGPVCNAFRRRRRSAFADLEGRLADADRDLLSSVVFADEVLEEEKAAEQAHGLSAQPQSHRIRSRKRPLCAPGSKLPNARGIFRKRCGWPKNWIEVSERKSAAGDTSKRRTAARA